MIWPDQSKSGTERAICDTSHKLHSSHIQLQTMLSRWESSDRLRICCIQSQMCCTIMVAEQRLTWQSDMFPGGSGVVAVEPVWLCEPRQSQRRCTRTQIQEQTTSTDKEIPQEIDVEKLMDEDVDEMILETDVDDDAQRCTSVVACHEDDASRWTDLQHVTPQVMRIAKVLKSHRQRKRTRPSRRKTYHVIKQMETCQIRDSGESLHWQGDRRDRGHRGRFQQPRPSTDSGNSNGAACRHRCQHLREHADASAVPTERKLAEVARTQLTVQTSPICESDEEWSSTLVVEVWPRINEFDPAYLAVAEYPRDRDRTAFSPCVVVIVLSFQSSETARPGTCWWFSFSWEGWWHGVNDLHAQRAEGVRAALEHQQSARSTWRCVLRRVSSESRAGGPADRESDESGEQTSQSTYVQCSTVAQRREGRLVTHTADHSGDAASDGWWRSRMLSQAE